MKAAILFGVALTAAVFIIPAVMVDRPVGELISSGAQLVLQSPHEGRADTSPQVPSAQVPEQTNTPVPQSVIDSGMSIRLLTPQGVETISLRDYLTGVVAAEMPVSFEPEALKCQAVTARTYVLYRVDKGGAHENADICSDSKHCSAYIPDGELREKWGSEYENNVAKIRMAVDGTDGMVIKCDGELIDAVFHSTSSGRTEAAVDVWGAERTYLQSVQSDGEESAPRYYGTLSLASERLRELILQKYPEADLSVPQAQWFSDVNRSESGGVTSLSVGGTAARGSEVRALLGLNSTNFNVTIDKGTFIFTTVGFGHGVGMSQYGANAMAKNGSTYKQILEHYYTGVNIEIITN